MLIRNKFQVEEEISRGAFGVIYRGRVVAPTRMEVASGAPVQVAIKCENTDARILRHEATILHLCNQHRVDGVPRMHWFGQWAKPTTVCGQWAKPTTVCGQGAKPTTDCLSMSSVPSVPFPCMVMTYYDMSLPQYMTHLKRQCTNIEHEAERIINRVLSILNQIHDLYVVHRDIKPDNIMVSMRSSQQLTTESTDGAHSNLVDDKGQVYLIDFGLATFYVDGATGMHVADTTDHRELVGSPLYASYNVHMGHTHSRRDDLIQLGYVYLYMLRGGSLPWQGQNDRGPIDQGFSPGQILHPANQRRMLAKQLDPVVYAHSSKHYQQYMNYVYGLAFDEDPEYG